jgi:hypothetical protein
MTALLNEKHERFCREVARGTNASRAYVAAGYQECRQSASRLLTRADIKQRIEEIKNQREIDNKNHRDPETGQFLAGHSGNGGRPKGSRNKLGEQFIADLHAEWQKSGAQALERMARYDATGFVKVVASVLPKEIDATVAVKIGLFEEVRNFKEAWDIARQVIGADDDKLIELQRNDDDTTLDS